MSKLTDRASYLKGLAEGMKLNIEKDANRLIVEIIQLLNETTDRLDAVEEELEDMDDYMADMEGDVAALKDRIFGDDDPEMHEEFDDEDERITYPCPSCGKILQFRTKDVDFSEDYRCPSCEEPVFPELADEDDDDPAPKADEDDDIESPESDE